MIRVLHVIGAMDRGGAETMIMNLYRNIDRERVQFDFMVHEERECDYDDEIDALGGHIYRVPRFNGLNVFEYRASFREFFRTHKEHAVVHGHIGSSAAVYLSEAKRAGCYTVAHSHNQKFPLSPSEIAFRAFSYPTRFVADYFMACSAQAGSDRFGSRFADEKHSKVLNNGADLSLYHCDESEHIAAKEELGVGDVPLLGHVGRFVPEKNHTFLLHVFASVKQEVPDAELVCVGRGPLLEQTKLESRNLHLSDSVHFLGVRDDVPEILKAIDVFLLPSVKEGLPLSAIEAQAAGSTCILSDGMPEETVITDSTKYIPLGTGEEAWARACVSSLQKEGLRSDRCDDAKEHGFDIRDSARWLETFYLGAVARR